MEQVPRLRVVGVSRSLPGVRALDDVSFDVLPSEIHDLVGENGAGKSTLMNSVAGVYQPDAGHLELDDTRVEIGDEKTATDYGIAMIQQGHSLAIRLNVSREHLRRRAFDSPVRLDGLASHADGHAPAVPPGRLVPARSIG